MLNGNWPSNNWLDNFTVTKVEKQKGYEVYVYVMSMLEAIDKYVYKRRLLIIFYQTLFWKMKYDLWVYWSCQ